MKRRISTLLSFERVLFFVLLGLTFASSLNAQPVDSKEVIIRIENDIVNYLRGNGELEVHSSLQEYKQRITIIECVDKTVLGYSKVGIYAFSVNTSHSKTYLLLKNEQQYEIVDPDNVVATLQKVSALLMKGKLSDSKAIEYIDSVVKIYKMNESRNPAALENKR